MSARDREQMVDAARRLTAVADRLAALRERLRPPAPGPAAPLFSPAPGSSGALDDIELHFEVDESGQSGL
jgi:hypothetical protein